MYEAKITSKGQITIPIEIRRYLDLHEGDKMSFQIKEDGIKFDKVSRPLTIQERFANYDVKNMPEDAMTEMDTGQRKGEEA